MSTGARRILPGGRCYDTHMRLRGDFLGAACALALVLPATASAAKRIVYVNTNPEVLINTAGQDPTMNSYSTTGFVPGQISGWPALTDSQKAELQYLMKEASLPFDIEWTYERPAVGTYDMLVMGTDTNFTALFPALGACSSAVSVLDCTDASAENISFFFWGCMTDVQQTEMDRVAHTAFTGLGFGWGLEQVSVAGEIMGGFTNTALEFGNTCVANSGAATCTHTGCAASTQNSTADMNATIGPRVDDGAPVVVITEPLDGAMLDASVVVRADVTDGFGGLTVELEIPEASLTQVDDNDPLWDYSWGLDLPAGPWTIKVNATDADGNVTSEEVQICVGPDPCDGGSSTAGGSTSSTGGSTSSGGGATTGEDTDSGGSGSGGTTSVTTTTTASTTAPTTTTGGLFGDDAESGCACTTDGKPADPGLLLFGGLGLLGLRRRFTRA
jgi:MYXO-CTERM domain-containing protein